MEACAIYLDSTHSSKKIACNSKNEMRLKREDGVPLAPRPDYFVSVPINVAQAVLSAGAFASSKIA